MPDDMITVPPGHKVVVYRPVATPSFGRVESGVVIADMGAGGDFEPVARAVENLVAAGHQGLLIWILQEAFVTRVNDWNRFVGRLEKILQHPGSRVGHCAVLPFEAAQRQEIAMMLKGLNIGVHRSADEGACFVEVHRPTGIVVGMPGQPL